MIHATTSKPLTFYIDSPSVRVFQEFAGESLGKLDEYEAWDVITALCQAASLASQYEQATIDIHETIEALGDDIGFSDHCKKCLEALHGFPASQVNALMVGILAVAFDV